MISASTTDLASWVGAEYGDGECWDPFLRDAFKQLAGVDLPESYYEALELFDTVHDTRRAAAFTPQPWDVVMIRNHAFLILHVAIALDAERFITPWGEVGVAIGEFTDERWSKRIAGFLRYNADHEPTEIDSFVKRIAPPAAE